LQLSPVKDEGSTEAKYRLELLPVKVEGLAEWSGDLQLLPVKDEGSTEAKYRLERSIQYIEFD